MSDQFNQPVPANPAGYSQQPVKKSSTGKWLLFGGLGCLGLVAICGGGIFALGWWGMGVVMDNPAYLASRVKVESSDEVKAAVGSPVELGKATLGIDPQGRTNTFQFTTPVSGPDGSGTMTWNGTMAQDGKNWTTNSLTVDAGGNTIDLMNEPDITEGINIDDGG